MVRPRSFEFRAFSRALGILIGTSALVFCSPSASAQQQTGQSASSLDERLRTLQDQLAQLQSAMSAMHEEILRSHAESADLRREMEATRSILTAAQPKPAGVSHEYPQAGAQKSIQDSTSVSKPDTNQNPQALDENQQLANAKLAELHQTKVESASKYPVRLSGIVLLNAMENRGAVDNLDFPSLAISHGSGSANGSFGATLRQSLLGLEVFGPRIHGARVSGDVQFDFAGGFPDVPNGSAFGLVRLRTGVVRLEWPNTSVIAGQDAPFFSPLSPSSVASLAIPEFSYAGNLWTWIPQVRVEHRFQINETSKVALQGGILDPLSGESTYSRYSRTPQAGEASRQPAYGTRVAWTRHLFNHDLTVGIGGYYSRQNWGFNRNLDGWAGTADWTIPLAIRWELSGELYRGRGIGGLGGGLGRSVVLTAPLGNPSSHVQGLNAIGGWTQLKFRQTEKLEWNAAYGLDNSYASDLRDYPFAAPGDYGASLARNHSGFLNFIYRPRSDLLFSVEYRRLQTTPLMGDVQSADHINLGIGVLF